MSLNNEALQAFRGIVKEVVNDSLKDIRSDLNSLKDIRNDLDSLKDIRNDLESLKDIRSDLKSMKADIKLLATLNQLDEIKKDSRLRVLYNQEGNQQEA